MAQNPFDQFDTGPLASPPQDPMKAKADARDERRLELAEEGSVRDKEKAAQGSAEQNKAASFLQRAINANTKYSGLGDVQPRSLPGQAFADKYPNAGNYISDSNRQMASQSEKEFIAAVLRYDSGAAIPPEEFVTQGQIYFPRPGDSPEVLKQKAASRLVAIQSLGTASGPSGRAALEAYNSAASKVAENEDDEGGLTGSVTDTGEGYAPDDPGAIPPNPPAGGDPDRSLGDYLSMGLRAAGSGIANLGAVTDALTGEGIASAITGAPTTGELARASGRDVADKLGLVAPVTPAERLTSAGIAGATGAMAFPGGGALMMGASGLGGGVAGEAARQAGAGPLGQLGATLAGGLAGGGVSAMARRRPGPVVDMEAVAAGERQGIPMRQPDAIPALRGKYGAAEATEKGGPMIRGAIADDAAAIEGRVQEIGGSGVARDQYAGGKAVQGALERQSTTAKASARADYERVEKLTQGDARNAHLEEFRREGNERFLDYTADNGSQADIHLIIGKDGRAEIAVNANNKARSNQFGPAQIRQAMDELKAKYPEIKTFFGGRETGAGPGRVQSVSTQYSRVDKMAKGAAVPPTQTIAAIDARIAELQAAGPGSTRAEVEVLQGIKDDLTQTGLSVKSLQAQRKGLRTRLNKAGMDYNAEQANFAGILDTAGKELQGGLNSINPAAGAALARADAAYAAQRAFRDTVAKEFMGTAKAPVSAETASQRLISMAQGKGNHDKFAAMWNVLDDAERSDLSATIAASLGRKANGDFSVSTLIGSLDPAKGINPRTAKLIFGDDGADALVDLRTIAGAKIGASSERNYSASGKVLNRTAGGLRGLIFGALGLTAGGPAGAVAAPMAGQFIKNWGEARAARMLLNQDFTKVLRNAPNTTSPKAIDAYFARVAAIPSIAANDNAAFASALREAASRLPGQAVAEEQEGDSRRAPPAN